MDQWSFTSPFEGVVPHIYLDSRGLPTAGVGFLVRNEDALLRLPWRPDSRAALADWHLVQEAEPGHPAHYYQHLCRARLREQDMRVIFDRKIDEFRRALDPGWHLRSWPEPVQIALIDMAYNLGVAKLAAFRRLHLAVFARCWEEAANESHRHGVRADRNEATRQLFLSARDVLV